MGGNSKSYALLTVPATAKDIKKGAALTGTGQDGNPVTGKAYNDYNAGSTEIRFQYKTTDTQWDVNGNPGYVGCRVGGMQSPADAGIAATDGRVKYYSADGCVDAGDGVKTVKVTFEDGTTENITPSAVAHKNGRTIRGFSTAAEEKMLVKSSDCPGCPYEDYEKYYNYYGSGGSRMWTFRRWRHDIYMRHGRPR